MYSEFDVKLGPQLVHQNPEGFFTKDEFGEIDKYLISKPEFDGKVMMFNSLLSLKGCERNCTYFTHSLTHWLTHSHTHSHTHLSFTVAHSLTHTFTHALILGLTH